MRDHGADDEHVEVDMPLLEDTPYLTRNGNFSYHLF